MRSETQKSISHDFFFQQMEGSKQLSPFVFKTSFGSAELRPVKGKILLKVLQDEKEIKLLPDLYNIKIPKKSNEFFQSILTYYMPIIEFEYKAVMSLLDEEEHKIYYAVPPRIKNKKAKKEYLAQAYDESNKRQKLSNVKSEIKFHKGYCLLLLSSSNGKASIPLPSPMFHSDYFIETMLKQFQNLIN
jgi:hypothetical protein